MDLATSNSTQSIIQHLVIEARHVDTRGVTRTIKLRFGILEGLRFDVVIRLYAIAINFMDVMQDLLTIQLEHQESQTHSLAMLYGTTPHLLMINSSPTSEVEADKSFPSVQPLSRDWGHSVQFILRWPCIYCPEQIAQQTAWEVNHPIGNHDFGDRGDLLSCDSIESSSPVMIPAHTVASTKGPSNNPIPLHSMNLHHMQDQQLYVAPGFRSDMRDALRPSPPNPPYPGIPDCPRSTLRLSGTHCLQAPSDKITTALIGTSNNTILEITTSTSRGTTQMMPEETHHRPLIIHAM